MWFSPKSVQWTIGRSLFVARYGDYCRSPRLVTQPRILAVCVEAPEPWDLVLSQDYDAGRDHDNDRTGGDSSTGTHRRSATE